MATRSKKHDSLFPAKLKKAVPFEFVMDALASLSPRTRPMFGCIAVYVGERIVIALRDKPGSTQDNGIWLATTEQNHESLRIEFPAMRSISVFGKEITSWQLIPSDSPDFEEMALRVCELIAARDSRIGKVPAGRQGNHERPSTLPLALSANRHLD